MPPEHERARAWRERLGLTIAELSEVVGYSPAAISWFERGETPRRTYSPKPKHRRGRKIDARVWLRYKRACHSVATKEDFRW